MLVSYNPHTKLIKEKEAHYFQVSLLHGKPIIAIYEYPLDVLIALAIFIHFVNARSFHQIT